MGKKSNKKETIRKIIKTLDVIYHTAPLVQTYNMNDMHLVMKKK